MRAQVVKALGEVTHNDSITTLELVRYIGVQVACVVASQRTGHRYSDNSLERCSLRDPVFGNREHRRISTRFELS